MRTQAIFQAIFDSIVNYQSKIYARMLQREPKVLFQNYTILSMPNHHWHDLRDYQRQTLGTISTVLSITNHWERY